MDPNADDEVEEVGAEEEEETNMSGGDPGVELADTAEEEEEVLLPEVIRRIRALKNIQLEVTKLETQFYKEMHALECKYLPLYKPLFDKRKKITTGDYEPNDAECDFALSEAEEVADAIAKVKLTESDGAEKEKVRGIPDFWLRIFKNVEMIQDMIETHDEPILKHLADITVEMAAEPMGFNLVFHFTPNEYFTNPILTKTYSMKCEMETEDPFSFEGPEIISSAGCHIDWIKGKNVTVKMVRKKQKHKQSKSVRTVNKTVETDSFFNFFNPPQVPEEGEPDLDEQTQIKLTTDFEVGQYIRERIIPHAVLYYTGEALDDEYEEEEEDEGEDDDDDEDDDNDEGGDSPNRAQKRGHAGKKPDDCKQQ